MKTAKTSELKTLIQTGLKVRRELIRTKRSRADLRDLFPKVVYWFATSSDIEKTALKRRTEIVVVLPPNYKRKFIELVDEIEKKMNYEN